jgi:hypothetical protein
LLIKIANLLRNQNHVLSLKNETKANRRTKKGLKIVNSLKMRGAEVKRRSLIQPKR